MFTPRNIFEQCCPWKIDTILPNRPFKQVFLGLLSPRKFHMTGKFPLPYGFLRAESPFHCIYCRVLMWSHYKYATGFLPFCWYKNLFLVSILDISYCMCLITSASPDFLSIGKGFLEILPQAHLLPEASWLWSIVASPSPSSVFYRRCSIWLHLLLIFSTSSICVNLACSKRW